MPEIKLNPGAQKLAELIMQILKSESLTEVSLNKLRELEESYPNNPMLNLMTYVYKNLDDNSDEIERTKLKVQLQQNEQAEFWLGNLKLWVNVLETETFTAKHIKAIFIEKYADESQLEGKFLKSLKA